MTDVKYGDQVPPVITAMGDFLTKREWFAGKAHTQAKTSEVYTKGAQRRILAGDAVKALAGFEW